MEFKIHKYNSTKSRKLDFFKEKNLVFANIENNQTMGIDALLVGLKGEEKIVLIEEKIVSNVHNIIKLPNGSEVIETTLSDYGSFNELYLNENMELLKTNNSEIITSLGKQVVGGIEVEIQKQFVSTGEVSAKEVILGIFDNKMEFSIGSK